MNNTDKEYFRLLNLILNEGRTKHNRTGIDTIGVFGAQAKFNLEEGFPILTTKKVWMKGIVNELLWFLKGDTNIKYLVDNDVHIWDEWAYKRYLQKYSRVDQRDLDFQDGNFQVYSQKNFIEKLKNTSDLEYFYQWGELGMGTYGGMWRDFPVNHHVGNGETICAVDQIETLINKLKDNPNDRRLIVTAWHPYWVDYCALPPCHCLFHFNTEELTEEEQLLYACSNEINIINVPKRRLNLLLYQRSCDTFLGVPFNITSYSLLLAMVAHVTNMIPGVFTHTYGDLHIYKNHLDQINEQLSREPKELPKLYLNPEIKNLFDFKYEDIKLENYNPHSIIKGEIAV